MNRKRNNKRNIKTSISSKVGDEIVVTGMNYSYITTVVTGAAQYRSPLTSNSVRLDPRTVVMSDLYRYYRFERLKITFNPVENSTLGLVAYIPGGTMTTPQTIPEVIQNQHVKIWYDVNSRNVTPATFNIPRGALGRAVVKWFLTEEAADPDLDTQGNLIFSTIANGTGGASASHIESIWEYQVRFRERLSSEESLRRRAVRLSKAEILPDTPTLVESKEDLEGEVKKLTSLLKNKSGGR